MINKRQKVRKQCRKNSTRKRIQTRKSKPARKKISTRKSKLMRKRNRKISRQRKTQKGGSSDPFSGIELIPQQIAHGFNSLLAPLSDSFMATVDPNPTTQFTQEVDVKEEVGADLSTLGT